MGEEKGKLEMCKDTGKQIIQKTGKVATTVLTIGKVSEELDKD